MRLHSDPTTTRAARLAARGWTLTQISERLGLHRSACYRRLRAANCERRWQPLSAAERRRIARLIEADYSRRDVAELVHRGLGTVARVAARLRGPEEHQGTRAYRCPGCGHLVHVRPCVICEARGLRS
jgi:IS30 family transposase